MGWPQIVIIVLLLTDTLLGIIMHGERRRGEHNFFVELIMNLILFLILKSGGFFD